MELSKNQRNKVRRRQSRFARAAKLKIGDLFVVGCSSKLRFWARRSARIPV